MQACVDAWESGLADDRTEQLRVSGGVVES